MVCVYCVCTIEMEQATTVYERATKKELYFTHGVYIFPSRKYEKKTRAKHLHNTKHETIIAEDLFGL